MNQPVPWSTDTPPEVADLWGRLHKEAQTRYKDLNPSTPRWVIGVALAVTALLLFGGGWGVNNCYFQPREATRQAQATAQAVALATAAQQTLDAGLSSQARTATAQASAFAATAQALDEQSRATAAAQAAAATAAAQALAEQDRAAATQAEALRCQNIQLYGLAVSEPVLRPAHGSVRVIGDPVPAVYATWRVTNTGECAWPWEQIGLRTKSDLRTRMASGARPGQFEIRPVEGEEGSPVEPGQAIEVLVYFSSAAAWRVEGEWVLAVNDLQPLVEQPYLQLVVEGWIISVTPSPSLSPTPTDTPIPLTISTLQPEPTTPPQPGPTSTSERDG
jgi:Flp pilus assembly protein TadG